MNPEFLPESTRGRAIRTYLLLIGCATRQQTITYGTLADRTGLVPQGNRVIRNEW